MQTTPYMPDSARAAMPNNAMQPLPPYLQRDFAQSLDRSRPHELILEPKQDPKRMGNLRYRYTDTGETALVPNCWYNQTVEMRLSYWSFELERHKSTLKKAQQSLAEAHAAEGPFHKDMRKEKAVLYATWHVQESTQRLATVQKIHDDVLSGERFL